MDDIRQGLRPQLARWLSESREAAAAPMAPEALRAALVAAAQAGRGMMRIAPANPVPVTATKCASEGIAYLDKLKLQHRWEEIFPPNDEPYHVLVVMLEA